MEKIFLEKIFRLWYILRGLRQKAKESDSLRKHGHSNLKASEAEVDSRKSPL